MAETKKIDLSKARAFPNNFEAERFLLCCMLIDGNVVENVVPTMNAVAFYNRKHRAIFQAIVKLNSNASAVDIVTVNDLMEKNSTADEGTLGYLLELSELLPSSANYRQYFDIIYRDNTLRDLITACNTIIEDCYHSTDEKESVHKAEELIYNVGAKLDKRGLTHITNASLELMDKINELAKNKGKIRGFSTGFPIYDAVTNGLQKGDLDILAARPSVGKTAFALNVLVNYIRRSDKEDKTIAVFSLEMPAVQLVQRLVCNLTNVSMNDVNKGAVVGTAQKNIWKINKEFGSTKIYINDSSQISPSEVFSQCRRLPSQASSKCVDLIIIDYLQLMFSDKSMNAQESRQAQVAQMSRMMKIMARELDCPVVLLSQMSRGIANRDDPRPKLSDLRESGAIEQDADMVMFLSREDDNDIANSPIILTIAKHRNGELKDIRYSWRGEYMRFIESDDQKGIEFVKKRKEQKRDNDGSEANQNE
ncbi:MAG: replicative DNA helicase [Clostridia bacterium]